MSTKRGKDIGGMGAGLACNREAGHDGEACNWSWLRGPQEKVADKPAKHVERRLAAGWCRPLRKGGAFGVARSCGCGALYAFGTTDGRCLVACEACAESMGVFADEPGFVGDGVVDLLKPMQRELDRIHATTAPVRCGHCPHGCHVGPCTGSSPSGEYGCPCGDLTEADARIASRGAYAVGKYRDDGKHAWSFKASPYEINVWSDAQAPTGMTGTMLAREKPARRELPKIRDIYRAGASMDGTEP